MNLTHLHLLINHLPIFGSILGAMVLAYALWTKNNQTTIAAYFVLIISAGGAVIAYLTGETAEETVEEIQGVAKDMIGMHEDAAGISLIALIILGLSSLVGLYLILKQSPKIRTFAFVTLFISLISFGLVARTGYLGGLIRHTELNSSYTNPTQGGEDKDED